ncbi:MAG TPA: hypothetical protein ENN03_00695 [bacterium]|nr:hypothetical protein [bacterium]
MNGEWVDLEGALSALCPAPIPAGEAGVGEYDSEGAWECCGDDEVPGFHGSRQAPRHIFPSSESEAADSAATESGLRFRKPGPE